MMDRVRNWSVLAFVFSFLWQAEWIVREVFVAGEKWQYATLGIYVSDIALLVAFSVFVLSRERETWREISRDVVVWLLGVLLLWSGMSSFWAIRADMALLGMWHIACLLFSYALVRFGGVSVRRILSVFLFALVIHAGLGISQWAMQRVNPSSALGIAAHLPTQQGASVLKTESGRFLRAYGGFDHPNVFGGALAFAVLFGSILFLGETSLIARVFLMASTATLSFSIVFTFSRSSWMAFFVGLAVLGFGCIRAGSERLQEITGQSNLPLPVRYQLNTWLLMACIALCSFVIPFSLVSDIALSRFSDTTLAREKSLSDRGVYLREAFSVIQKSPIIGIGAGNFTAFTMSHFPDHGQYIGAFQPVHIVPMLIFSELGVVGFLLMAGVFLVVLRRASCEQGMRSLSLFVALFPLLLLDHFLWTGHFGVMMLGVILGVVGKFSSASTSTKALE